MKKQIYTTVKRTGAEEFIFLAVINDKGVEKTFKKKIEEKTDNRAIILGLVKMLEDFETKQELDIYTKLNFGFKALKRLRKWRNIDLGRKLSEVIKEKQLKISFYNYNDPKFEDLKWIDSKMKKLMREILDKEKQPTKPSKKKPEVSIYVRGECETLKENRPGRYIVLIRGKYNEKTLQGIGEHTTSNRMIITGLIEALKLINVPYRIKFYTHAFIGLKKAYKVNKGPNSDLLEELVELLELGGHDLEEYIGDYMQTELRACLHCK